MPDVCAVSRFFRLSTSMLSRSSFSLDSGSSLAYLELSLSSGRAKSWPTGSNICWRSGMDADTPAPVAGHARAPAAASTVDGGAVAVSPKRIDILPPFTPDGRTDKQLCSWKHPPSRLRAKCRFPPASSGAVLRALTSC